MALVNMEQRANRITRFVTVQLIALVGWIIVQSFFSLSSFGRTFPFAVTMGIEAICGIATLVIMFLLFRREYSRFVLAGLDLDEPNRRLNEMTNNVLLVLTNQDK